MKEKIVLLIVIVIFAVFYYNQEIHKSQIILELVEKKAKELSQFATAMPNHSTAASSSLATTPVTPSYSNLVGFGPHNSHFSNAPMDTNNAANSSNFIFRFSFDESLSRF